MLDQTVGEGGFSVIDMGDDTEVSDGIHGLPGFFLESLASVLPVLIVPETRDHLVGQLPGHLQPAALLTSPTGSCCSSGIDERTRRSRMNSNDAPTASCQRAGMMRSTA